MWYWSKDNSKLATSTQFCIIASLHQCFINAPYQFWYSLEDEESFHDCLNPLCSCSLETEVTQHLLLHCYHFSNHRADLMNSAISVCDNFESMSDNVKKNVLLYGDSRFDEFKNRFILEATITFIKTLNGSLDLFLIDKFSVLLQWNHLLLIYIFIFLS